MNSPNWIVQVRTRLARRRMEKPATKAGQVRALWAEIEAALQGGQSVKSICKWLEEDAGIIVGVTSLTSYISRIRRRETTNPCPRASAPPLDPNQLEPAPSSSAARTPLTGPVTPMPPKPAEDPLAPAMRALSRPKIDIRDLHNDGDPENSNLI